MKKRNNKRRTDTSPANIEIDYDKLADAIVRANKRIEQASNKRQEFRGEMMRNINGLVYLVIGFASIYGAYLLWKSFHYTDFNSLVECIVKMILLGCMAIYMFVCQQESLSDDEESAFKHFSTNVSLVALIVALIAFLKGGS